MLVCIYHICVWCSYCLQTKYSDVEGLVSKILAKVQYLHSIRLYYEMEVVQWFIHQGLQVYSEVFPMERFENEGCGLL